MSAWYDGRLVDEGETHTRAARRRRPCHVLEGAEARSSLSRTGPLVTTHSAFGGWNCVNRHGSKARNSSASDARGEFVVSPVDELSLCVPRGVRGLMFGEVLGGAKFMPLSVGL